MIRMRGSLSPGGNEALSWQCRKCCVSLFFSRSSASMHSRVFAWGTVVSRPQNRQILGLCEELALATVPSMEIRSVATNGARVQKFASD